MRIIWIFFVAGMLVAQMSCQHNSVPRHPFRCVALPDSVLSEIKCFYKNTENRDSILGQILVFNIKNLKDYPFKEGLFRFRLSGPHFQTHYFVYKKNKIHIFQNNNTVGILNELLKWIGTLNITELEKVELIELTALMLREAYELENN